MTFFRRHNAQITLRQTGKTGVTVTLAEAFFSGTTTVDTADFIEVLDGQLFTQLSIQIEHLTTQS